MVCTTVDPSVPINFMEWWWNNQGNFLILFQDALDKLAIPVISAECERVFSSAGKMITPERNRLGDEIIEAGKCLKAWWDSGLII
jgi:hAT family C-terminal dimerisation region